MLKIKKTASFTLAEMLVVLLLTSIVVSMAIVILMIVQKEMKSIQANYKNNTELRTLEQALWKDLSSHRVYYDRLKGQLIAMAVNDTVVYQFKPTYIVRNTDTLNLSILEKKYFLDSKIIESNGEIDALELIFSKQQNQKKLFIYKNKAATYYMNKTNGI
ncbi:PulJ/GspJ family protein [Lutibacter sp.]